MDNIQRVRDGRGGEIARVRNDLIPWKQMQEDRCMYELTETMAAHAKHAQVPVRQGPKAEQGKKTKAPPSQP